MYELFLLILQTIGQESLVASIYINSVFAIELVSENCQFSYTTGTIGTENAYAIAWVVLICGVGMAVPLILIANPRLSISILLRLCV